MKRVITNVPTDKLRELCDDLTYENKGVEITPNKDGSWNIYYFPK